MKGDAKTFMAKCSCAQLQLESQTTPGSVSLCHCFDCQRRSGSAFAAQTMLKKSDVCITGRSTQFTRIADSGNRVDFHFCPDCGATVYYYLEVFPDNIVVPLGAFAGLDLPVPTYSVYEERMHHWIGLPKDMEHLP